MKAKSMKDLLINPHGVPETWLAEAEKQLIKGFKEYTIPKWLNGDTVSELKLKILHPNQDVDLLVAEAYNFKFNELMAKSELKTWDELKLNLNERGLWTDAENKKFENQDESLRNVALEMTTIIRREKIDKKKLSKIEESKFEKIQNKFDEIQLDIHKLNVKYYKYYMQSVEGQANQYSQYVKIINCVMKEDGNKLWSSLDSFKNEPAYNRNAIAELSSVAYQFWAGMSQEILQCLPDSIGEGTKDDGSVV